MLKPALTRHGHGGYNAIVGPERRSGVPFGLVRDDARERIGHGIVACESLWCHRTRVSVYLVIPSLWFMYTRYYQLYQLTVWYYHLISYCYTGIIMYAQRTAGITVCSDPDYLVLKASQTLCR